MKHTFFLLIMAVCSLTLFGVSGCSTDSANWGSVSDNINTGVGGSMARFTIYNDYMYTVDNFRLNIVSLENPATPQHLKSIDLGMDIETIFCYDRKLFIGSQSGMYIFDITNPQYPSALATVSHITSCDPVVAYGNYAYLTLNSGSLNCFRGVNELVIYNISDVRNPQEVRRISMNSPKGLAVDGNRDLLFVCDAGFGVKMYDISNPETDTWPVWIGDLTASSETRNISAYDVIAIDGLLIVSASEGIYLLDYTSGEMILISKIS